MFRPENLEIDSDAYQNTAIEARDFHLRLFEITAVAIHTIAAHLFLHTNQPPYNRPPCPRLEHIVGLVGEGYTIPTYLFHQDYIDHDQYPMDVADMVGYWAEYWVFGGVVLFDRGESETEFRDVYFHTSADF
ncbi:hypothetical protein NUU61_010009 [Penicillium alfredii]|uniref:Uncharacterized protein n=1 Tax=Penicillium alfredii TaxID=1506179 RepID=A0A9W9EHF1_9EURO|nr:uncharacterized protein NUU61_010009 [Penicillium alfredii]KAJ5081745.1 hypothetical protein NUU61_010009 [Penicillium alfredii]